MDAYPSPSHPLTTMDNDAAPSDNQYVFLALDEVSD